MESKLRGVVLAAALTVLASGCANSMLYWPAMAGCSTLLRESRRTSSRFPAANTRTRPDPQYRRRLVDFFRAALKHSPGAQQPYCS